ncbi:MAG: uroporphyrinogen-III synthase [Lewinellaceae bacterium]|nr:uroporphyrinogen-III synthase [Lewinellaceae bacterium]
MEKRFDVRIDFVPFVTIEGLTGKEYRKNRVYPNDYTAIVFTSKNAVDHFFAFVENCASKCRRNEILLFDGSDCQLSAKFIMFRKRKVFNGTKSIPELKSYILRNKEEKFFLPCNDQGNPDVIKFFRDLKVPIQEAVMYRTVNNDLTELKDIKYDIIAFFSALEIKSMFEQFPDFKQEDRRICVFGTSASKAVTERGMTVSMQAGTPEAPSIAVALENYLKVSNKK